MKARLSLAFACDVVPVQVKSGVQTLVLSLTLRQPSILKTDRLSSQLRAP
jgi:hypothetical protein